METLTTAIIIQELADEFLKSKNISLHVLREDLVHPILGGNKFRKLKYNLQQAQKEGYRTLLTFGGAYSNHLAATAVAGKQSGFKTIGLVRGEETLPLNKSLQTASDFGMQLNYVSRDQYKAFRDTTTHASLYDQFGKSYILPEGGSNLLAVNGCSEIMQSVKKDFDIICVASGTGATLAGIVSALKPHQHAIGYCVLKNSAQITTDINNWLLQLGITNKNWKLSDDYHFGGYAKTRQQLLTFTTQFITKHGFAIEPVYTGKLFYGIFEMIKNKRFKSGSRILAVHTGGLQYL